MGLLNHIFGNKKDIAKEIIVDNDKRMALWQEHLTNSSRRELLSKHFSFGNIDKAIQDFKSTQEILEQIVSLISSELISINDEEKLDNEIIADLKRLKSAAEIESLSHTLVYENNRQTALLAIFREIHDVLITELHLIRLIEKKPSNLRELLLELFSLIFHKEAMLYKPFKEASYFEGNKKIYDKISKLMKAALLQEEIKEEMETDEEKFAREMVKQMSPFETRSEYRKLGEDIFFKLAEMAGAPLATEKILEGIEKMEKMFEDDDQMYAVIKKLRPKYDDTKIKGVIFAFRAAYNLGHFEDLGSEFAT